MSGHRAAPEVWRGDTSEAHTTAGRVALIGGGSMGAALAHVVASDGRRCALWCTDPVRALDLRQRRHPFFDGVRLSDGIEATTDMEEALRGAALVVVAVPSRAFRDTARRLRPCLASEPVLLTATKALEPGTHRRMSEVLAEETGATAIGAVSGPNVTPEIVAGQPAEVVVSSPDPEVRARSERLLRGGRFRVSVHEDLLSAELASAMKNVVAVGVGLADGMGLGANFQSLVFTRGLDELATLAAAMGADRRVFYGLAGLGDLFLTATSAHSLNRRVGVECGRGKTLPEILAGLPERPEGPDSCRACRALAIEHGLSLPLVLGIAQILEGEAPTEMLESFVCR